MKKKQKAINWQLRKHVMFKITFDKERFVQ